MEDPQAARRRRAAERAALPGRKLASEQELSLELMPGSFEERIAEVWRLTRLGWAISGRPYPDYDRASAPGRVFREGER